MDRVIDDADFSVEQLKSELSAINMDLVYFTRLFDAYCKKSSFAEAMIETKSKQMAAQTELIQMIKQQIELNESIASQVSTGPEKTSLDGHKKILLEYLRRHERTREKCDKESKQYRSQLKQTERELNIEVKPNLQNLTHRKENIYKILYDRGYTHDAILEMDCADSSCENDALSLRESAWLIECTRDEAVDLLRNKQSGTFLIRPSQSTPYALSIVVNGKVHHCRIIHDGNFYGFSDPYIVHPDLRSLVRHYRHNSLEKHNSILKQTYMSYPLNLDQVANSQVLSDLFKTL